MYFLNINSTVIHFKKVLKQQIYVDKSLLIEALNKLIGTHDCYVCITRPRRFGKTMNANMLGAYYTKGLDSHELFQNLAVSECDTYTMHLNRHNVIYMDLSRRPDECSSYREYIEYVIFRITQDIEEAYGIKKIPGMSVSDLLTASGEEFVFILDEWDSVFYESFMQEEEKIQYLKFLKGLLKDQPYVELAYMTGVLPVAKYSSGSELNMFAEYNFINDNVYDGFFGFQEEEVRELCRRFHSVSYEEMKKWYDGYFTSAGKSLFNPRSVTYALTRGVCLNYWTETGPMNEIADCIEHNVDEVREDIVKLVARIPVQIKLKGYSASERRLDTRNEILSAMVVYGFLSYYDGFLWIPNNELMEKYQEVLSRNSMGEVKQIVEQSREILEFTLAGNETKVAELLEEVHDREIPFLQYNDENALSCVITLCYLSARDSYEVQREAKSGKGYCDYLFLPKRSGISALILELKVGKSCEAALEQIKTKGYMKKVEKYQEIVLVGINYDRQKKHTCKIERWVNGHISP